MSEEFDKFVVGFESQGNLSVGGKFGAVRSLDGVCYFYSVDRIVTYCSSMYDSIERIGSQ